jgi:hypothetical protein
MSLRDELRKALCLLAGARRGATLENLYNCDALQQIVRPDKNLRPDEQGKKILTYLEFEIDAFDREIIAWGILIEPEGFKQAIAILFLLMAKNYSPGINVQTWNSRERRLAASRKLGLGVSWES